MGVIRWEDEQHSFLRAGWLQALSRLPTITHSIPNTHTQECSLPSTNYSTWLPLSRRTYRGQHAHTSTQNLKSQFWGGELNGLTSNPWCHQTHASGSDGIMLNITFILNHGHRVFLCLSFNVSYHRDCGNYRKWYVERRSLAVDYNEDQPVSHSVLFCAWESQRLNTFPFKPHISETFINTLSHLSVRSNDSQTFKQNE